jgi:hypothetical protein
MKDILSESNYNHLGMFIGMRRFVSRVARFSSAQCTKTGRNTPNDLKMLPNNYNMYQMAVYICNISKLPIPRPSKYVIPNLVFWGPGPGPWTFLMSDKEPTEGW